MNNSNYYISLDVHDTASQALITVKKGDNSRKICASLTENGKEYVIAEGCTAVFTAKKPDGKKLYNDCVIEDNTITYTTTNNTTSAVGLAECEFRLISPDDKLLVCPRFTLIVEDTVVDDDDVMDSSDEFSELSKMVGRVERADSVAQEALETAEEAVERADSVLGVYVGTGDMPEGYVIQIDPTGEVLTLDNAMSDTSEGVVKNKVIKEYVDKNALPKIIGYCGSDTAGTAGWYKVCTASQTRYSDNVLTLLLTSTFGSDEIGMLHIHTRCNDSTTVSIPSFHWMYRSASFNVDDAIIVCGNGEWSLYVYRSTSQYGRIQVQVISKSGTAGDMTFSLSNNSMPVTARPTEYVAAEDKGIVNGANLLTTARTIQTNLAGANAASFNGTANVTPGVIGTLPIANGGTGVTAFDTKMSDTSANLVQNKVIKAYVDSKTAPATESTYGTVKLGSSLLTGLEIDDDGCLQLFSANAGALGNGLNVPVTGKNLTDAVKLVVGTAAPVLRNLSKPMWHTLYKDHTAGIYISDILNGGVAIDNLSEYKLVMFGVTIRNTGTGDTHFYFTPPAVRFDYEDGTQSGNYSAVIPCRIGGITYLSLGFTGNMLTNMLYDSTHELGDTVILKEIIGIM